MVPASATVTVPLSALFDDFVIYRDLNPVDPRVPGYSAAWQEMGMAGPIPPRKQEPAYAQALAWLLERGRALDAPGATLSEILYLGDTTMSDGGAFLNLRALTGWRGWCFIGAEKGEPPALREEGGLVHANRWRLLAEFLADARARGAALDPRTVALIDIDKTAIGARGRNDGAIDRARVAAIEATLREALGPAFDAGAFKRAYAALNVSKYHPFTADNQDNLAYVCLMLGEGMDTLEGLQGRIAGGSLPDYAAYMAAIDARRGELSPAVAALHDDIWARVQAGDLTPFKAFRRREYVETVDRMGHLPEDAPLAQRLQEEVCFTREVLDACLWLHRRGCLMVGLSDKPDEATAPSVEETARGYLPLHRTPATVIGDGIAALLGA
jgi:hypothetical protein